VNEDLSKIEIELRSISFRVDEIHNDLKIIELSNSDTVRRIEALEKFNADRLVRTSNIQLDVELSKSAIQDIREKLVNIVEGLNIIAKKFDQQHQEIQNLYTAAHISHNKRMKTLITITSVGTALLILLTQVYANLVDKKLSLFPMLF
jgi:chromosome segregation ATPase